MPEFNKNKEEELGKEVTPRRRGVPEPIFESRCKICKSDHRGWIEVLLAKGESYRSIVATVPEKLTISSLSNHAKKHTQYNEGAVRKILEHYAEERSQDYETAVQGAVTRRGVLEVMLREGHEAIISGKVDIEARDIIMLVQQIEKMDKEQEEAAIEQAKAHVGALIQAIRDIAPESIWPDIFAAYKRNLNGEEEVKDVPGLPTATDTTAVEI
jgi:hypothetical protein